MNLVLKLLKKTYKRREVFGYLTFFLYLCNMRRDEFIGLMNKRIKEGKFISKILYDGEASISFKRDFPRDNILYIQTDIYQAWKHDGHVKPMVTVLLDNKCILPEEWSITGIGTGHAVDIVDPSIEDYMSLSLFLKRKKLRYNRKLNKIEKL